MILLFSLVILMILFMNFSMASNKLNMVFIFKIFMDIKSVSVFLIKMMSLLVVFLFVNYNSYIYYSVGLSMQYGYVFIYAFLLVFMGWLLWAVNNIISMLSHFLPLGIQGILKVFIPVLEVIGVLIRPLTLAIRLATNISCGHVALLMFSFFAFNVANYLVFSISVLLFGLYFIEFLVCMIQAYVFRSLLYIYMMEVEI
uniref:ATP synthase subunit a n=1 Tax=Rotaria rotatoria TaxID=231624 RepID=D1KRS4_9BILA|nr:ATP synthase F0 subunit 6 [Rotaria rotatoria]ACT21456.1 ATP synthase F0 subunit 6 [Rotaria rotatoria]